MQVDRMQQIRKLPNVKNYEKNVVFNRFSSVIKIKYLRYEKKKILF